MSKKEYKYLPEVKSREIISNHSNDEVYVKGNSPCPCCGFITIPNNGDALSYVCPVCLWEIDLFLKSDNEASDLNHGLTLIEARKNYKDYGAVLYNLKEYSREPLEKEYPNK
ncbi:CPCC family cysteine-rich protein [Clostridium isatidis]|uniref:CPCC family cysteine-rich protein n=1 Tax=Clostridium isatidis TaxID=182773 RepID=UPI003AAB9DEB